MAFIRKDKVSAQVVDTKKAEQLLSYFIDVALDTNKSISELANADSKKLWRGKAVLESAPQGIVAFDKLREFELYRLGYEIGALRLMYKALKHSEFRSGQKDMLKFIKQSLRVSRVGDKSKLGQMEEAKFKADLMADRMLQITKRLKHDLAPKSTLDVDKRMQVDSYIEKTKTYENSLIKSFMDYVEKLRENSKIEYLKLRFKRE